MDSLPTLPAADAPRCPLCAVAIDPSRATLPGWRFVFCYACGAVYLRNADGTRRPLTRPEALKFRRGFRRLVPAAERRKVRAARRAVERENWG